jgi:hypothetical protein
MRTDATVPLISAHANSPEEVGVTVLPEQLSAHIMIEPRSSRGATFTEGAEDRRSGRD